MKLVVVESFRGHLPGDVITDADEAALARAEYARFVVLAHDDPAPAKKSKAE